MPTIQTLTIHFSFPIFPAEIKYFRGAIVEMVMQMKHIFEQHHIPTDVFHNHDEDSDTIAKTLNRFPFIQYQVHNKKCTMIGLGIGADALDLFMQYKPPFIQFNNRTYPFTFTHFDKKIEEFKFLAKPKLYRMYAYLGLQEDKYDAWQTTPRLTEKLILLEDSLSNSIYRCAKQFGWPQEKRISAFIHGISKTEYLKYKEFSLLAFHCTFGANITIPENIAIGKGCSIGFGKVQSLPDKKHQTKTKKISETRSEVEE